VSPRRGILWRLVHSSPGIRIALYFFLFFFLIFAYAIIFHYYYPLWEGKPITWPTAVLFVVETMSTTGFGELLPFFSDEAIIFTILVMVTGIVMIFMIVPLLLAPYLGALLTSTPPRKTPRQIRNHVVIVGYGELARSLIESLLISDLEIVIVDDDRDVVSAIAKQFRLGAYVVWGDYDDPATWSGACIRDASFVVISEEERTATSIVLGIREMTAAKIITVVDKLAFDRHLRSAGSDFVLSPKHITGRILARHAVPGIRVDSVREGVVPEADSLYGRLTLIHVPIMPGSPALGKRLDEIETGGKYGFCVPFISKGGRFIFRPSPRTVTDQTTRLFLIGREDEVRQMMETEFIPKDGDGSLAIIAGYGDVGSTVYQELGELGISCIVVDQKEYRINEVVGAAEDEKVLRAAHIEDAHFCIIALNDDHVNIFTTLIARDMNRSLRILARANEPESLEKLYRAGADYVALLPVIGGQMIAGVVLSDIITIILDLPNGLKVVKGRMVRHAGRSVGWLAKKTGAWIIGVEGGNRTMVNPAHNERIGMNETVIAIGETDQLKRFIRHL
jgi:voltage-gated potassium channel